MPRSRSREAREAARKARKDPSVAERHMWAILRGGQLGFKFRREHPIGPYRLDFYCREALLAVELDGEQHDPAKDAERDKALAELGILTYRIPTKRFLRLDEQAFAFDVQEIQRLCMERSGLATPHPPAPSPPEGRGGVNSDHNA